MSEIKRQNQVKFEEVRALNLPAGEYAISASGPLGIRGLRLIGDIDLIVTPALWEKLKKGHPMKTDNGINKIELGDNIEVLGPDSIWTGASPNDPSGQEQIHGAELIEGLPFISLKHVIYFKRKMGRDKDLKDLGLIEEWQKQNN